VAESVAPRRRILVAVEPRVLGDALAAVLAEVGLDEVLVSGTERADDPEMPIDVAVLSRPHPAVSAKLIIEVDSGLTASVVTAADAVDVVLASPHDLLAVLDEYCPASSLRVAAPAAGGVHR
jgi:hypothetical protein